MNRFTKKLISLLLVLGIIGSLLPVAAAEETEDEFFFFPVFTGGKGYNGNFLARDGELYISTDTLEFIGASSNLKYADSVLGKPDRMLTRSDGEEEITLYLYEDDGDYIDAEDDRTYINYKTAMSRLWISTRMESGHVLFAEPAKQVKNLQNKLLSYRNDDIIGMSTLRDERLLGLINKNDGAHLLYLFFNAGKNIGFAAAGLGITSTELYQQAYREIMLPTDANDYIFGADKVELLESLATVDGAADDIFSQEVIKKVSSTEIGAAFGESMFYNISSDLKQHYQDLIGHYERLGWGMDLLQIEDRIANAAMLNNVDKVEDDILTALDNLFSCTEGIGSTYMQVGLAIELEKFQRGEFSDRLRLRLLEDGQGAAALADDLLLEADDTVLSIIGQNNASAKYSRAVASLIATGISVSGDILFGAQDKIDAALMTTTYLNISEAAYDAIGIFANRINGVDWDTGRGELLEDMRNLTTVYLRACRGAWKASVPEGGSDPVAEGNIGIINKALQYINSFEDSDFTVVKDAAATRNLMLGGHTEFGTRLSIVWFHNLEQEFGSPVLDIYTPEGELLEPTYDEYFFGHCIDPDTREPIAMLDPGDPGEVDIFIKAPCRITFSNIFTNVNNLHPSFRYTGPDGETATLDKGTYLRQAETTKTWGYDFVVDRNGALLPGYGR